VQVVASDAASSRPRGDGDGVGSFSAASVAGKKSALSMEMGAVLKPLVPAPNL